LKITVKNVLPFLILLNFSCHTGNLTVIADLPKSLDEVSAAEITSVSDLLWVIEDAGNKNVLYGLNAKGKIEKALKITNAQNKDWEDLASDSLGNIYIGDFGNNNKNRVIYSILKVEHPENLTKETTSQLINFTLPKGIKSQDFEAFFLMKNNFYIFSKNDKHGKLFKVPNSIGNHEAIFITDFNLKGKNNAITSADYFRDNIALLNHEKVWMLSSFKNDEFFNGTIKSLPFEHKSQKEGVCFKNNSTLIITDEYTKKGGGNIYVFNLN
jgi:hypothetical protein